MLNHEPYRPLPASYPYLPYSCDDGHGGSRGAELRFFHHYFLGNCLPVQYRAGTRRRWPDGQLRRLFGDNQGGAFAVYADRPVGNLSDFAAFLSRYLAQNLTGGKATTKKDETNGQRRVRCPF